jgi:ankyrin repeat protein
VKLIKFLLDKRADINIEDISEECDFLGNPDYFKSTPLHEAVNAANLNVLRFLMDRETEFDVRNIRGEIIFDKTIINGYEVMADILLNKYSYFRLKYFIWSTVLQTAIFSKSKYYFNDLIQRKTDINASKRKYGNAIDTTIKTNNKNIVLKLLNISANPNVFSHCSAL